MLYTLNWQGCRSIISIKIEGKKKKKETVGEKSNN